MGSLFGVELPTPVNFIIAFVFVLLLIGAAAWLVRRFGGYRGVIEPGLQAGVFDQIRVRAAVEDRPILTEREREVLALMAEGRSNGAISKALFLSKKTVETHVRTIFLKLDLTMSPDDDRRVLAVLTMLRAMP